MGQLIQFKIDKTRALVQATASFGSLPVVIWEYVVNGLAYQIQGKMPCVEVTIKKSSVLVTLIGVVRLVVVPSLNCP